MLCFGYQLEYPGGLLLVYAEQTSETMKHHPYLLPVEFQ
jgi:hypothetical protein